MLNSKTIVESALAFGFDECAVSRADPLERDGRRLEDWRQAGFAAGMNYMLRPEPKRWVVQDLLAPTLTVISLAIAFSSEVKNAERRLGFGRVARYAWGLDYHDVLPQKIFEWILQLQQELGQKFQAKILTDAGPILERAWMAKGSEPDRLGFIGKNTLYISRKWGSHAFLAEVLCDLPVEVEEKLLPVEPGKDACGACDLCLARCPTQAFAASRMLDARKCISYWTIEHRGAIEENLWRKFGDWVFGCDVCQDVCPYNVRPKPGHWREFFWGGVGPYLDLLEVLSLKSSTEFKQRFAQTPLLRTKREGLIRNACIVTANQNFKTARPELERLAQHDESEVVRAHALSALNYL